MTGFYHLFSGQQHQCIVLYFLSVFLRFPQNIYICSFVMIIKLPAVFQVWVFWNCLASRWGVSVRHSFYMGKNDSGIFHSSVSQVCCRPVFPDHPEEGVHLSQEGQSHSLAAAPGLSLGCRPTPPLSSPFSGLQAPCFDLCRKFPFVLLHLPLHFPSSHRNLRSRLCPEVRTETAAR